jgi:putative transposase
MPASGDSVRRRSPARSVALAERTVSPYMPRRAPPSDAVQRWVTFLCNHREAIGAMDLFVVPTARFRVLYVWFAMGHGRRRILHFAVTSQPAATWVVQQLRETFPFDVSLRHLIFDRDTIFSALIVSTVKSFGIDPARTGYRSPWQNGVAERRIGSVRRELLDHVVVLDEHDLQRLLRDYVAYYHEDRTHLALSKETPTGRGHMKRPVGAGRVVGLPRVGGPHHRYDWRIAA